MKLRDVIGVSGSQMMDDLREQAIHNGAGEGGGGSMHVYPNSR